MQLDPLAPAASTPTSAALARAARVQEVATDFLRLRPLVLGPFFLTTGLVLWATGAPRTQTLALAGGSSFFLSVFVLERVRAARRPVSPAALGRSLRGTLLGIGLASTATGGVTSPLVPMLFAPLGIGFAAFGPSREQTRLSAVFVAVVATLVTVAYAAPRLSLPTASTRPVLVLALAASAILLRVGVAGLTEAHGRAADNLARASEALARESEARMRDLELVGSRLAHEVKNPLTAVRSLVESMQETADPKGQRRLGVMATEVRRIQGIVEGYAALARPLDTVRPVPTAMRDVLTALVATLEDRAARAQVRLTLSLPEGPGPVVPVDPLRVHEAFVNLLSNALEACDPSRGEARVHVGCTVAEGCVRVTVTDNGRGMDDATRAQVGTPFFTQRPGGTGLGVAHARRVFALHGATLVYTSQVGQGTEAAVTFAPTEGT